MTDLLVVDDAAFTWQRLTDKQHPRYLSTLKYDFSLAPELDGYLALDNEGFYVQLLDGLGNSKPDTRLAVLLDMGYRKEFPPYDDVVALCQRLKNDRNIPLPVAQSTWDGLSIIEKILETPNIKECFILVCTANGDNDVSQAIFAINALQLDPERKIVTERSPGLILSDERDAFGLPAALQMLRKGWDREFNPHSGVPPPQEYHSDPNINDVLIDYSTAPSYNGLDAWHHNWCQATDGPATRALERLVANTDGSSQFGSDAAGLGQRSVSLEGAFGFSLKDAYYVSRDTIIAICHRLDLHSVQVECSVLQFPVTPGVAFMIALKELTLSMETDRKGAPPVSLKFADHGDVYSLTIELNLKQDDRPFGHARGYLEKLRRDHPNRPQDGFSGALESLSRGATPSIRVVPSAQWLDMFREGHPEPVSIINFDANCVRLIWPGEA